MAGILAGDINSKFSSLKDHAAQKAGDAFRHVTGVLDKPTSAETQRFERTIVPYELQPWATNAIRTTKYTWYSFVPKNVFEQFHSLANVYFLILSAMQCIPSISISHGIPTIFPPLMLVLGVSALRDAMEDIKRGRQDRKENLSTSTLLKAHTERQEQAVLWQDIRPGTVLLLRAGDAIPADCLLLESSDPENICLLETAELDGETNLKRKVTVADMGNAQWWLRCEEPSSSLYEWRGALHKDGADAVGVSVNSLLLRGTSLRCTEWIICMAVYCGHDTRVMKNSQGAQFKQSRLDTLMNGLIVAIFIGQLMLSVFAGVVKACWNRRYGSDSWYLGIKWHNNQDPGVGAFLMDALLGAGTWELQLGNAVPISLLVCLLIVKLSQGYFISYDLQMSTAVHNADGSPKLEPLSSESLRTPGWTQVHTSQVLENLGMVTHVFSDKTGTLTQNVMEFRACSVNSQLYGVEEDGCLLARDANQPKVPYYDFADAAFRRDISRSDDLVHFVVALACCHTVTPKGNADLTEDNLATVDLEYEASSPDELAMVSTARALGLVFLKQQQNHMRLRITDTDGPLGNALQRLLGLGANCSKLLNLEVLDVCDFDNDRKRMSIVMRLKPGAKPLLITKGADSSVLPFVNSSAAEDSKLLEDTNRHLTLFSCNGLRTLVFAQRELADAEYEDWHQRHERALASLSDTRGVELQKLAIELEESSSSRLLGVTAIEDKLQDGVPETIHGLRKAGISVWVLTGDKLETAINIGLSCQLLHPDMTSYEIRSTSSREIAMTLTQIIANPKSECGASLAVTGAALAVIMDPDRSLSSMFYQAVRGCVSVLCCRVSPKQKSDVVSLLKELDPSCVTLSIGDGANDVSMITTADVGIGVSGMEGAQATRAADFAIFQFRFLSRLLFLHGRESNRRNSMLVLYNFYKNGVIILVALFYGFYMGFSGQSVYDPILYQAYNVIFSFLPVIFYGIFDRPCQDLDELVRKPEVWYNRASRADFFNWSVSLRWTALALVHAYSIHRAVWLTYGDYNVCGHNTVGDLATTSTAALAWVILTVNFCLLLQSFSHFIFTVVLIVLCVGSYSVSVKMVSMTRLSGSLKGSVEALWTGQCPRFYLVTMSLMAGVLLTTALLLGLPICRTPKRGAFVRAPVEVIAKAVVEFINKFRHDSIKPEDPVQRQERVSGCFELQELNSERFDSKAQAQQPIEAGPQRPSLGNRSPATSFSKECCMEVRSKAVHGEEPQQRASLTAPDSAGSRSSASSPAQGPSA